MVNTGKGNRKAERQQGITLLSLAFAALILSFILAGLSSESRYTAKDVRKFENVLHQKEDLLEREFSRFDSLTGEASHMELLEKHSRDYQELSEKEGLSLFYYVNRELKYWSDHTVPVPESWRPRLNRSFQPMRNGDYISFTHELDTGQLLGLIKIRSHYPIENQFLKNEYHPDFKLDGGAEIEFFEAEGLESVLDRDGNYLFSFNFVSAKPGKTGLRILAYICLLVFLIALFAGSFRVIRQSRGRQRILLIAGFTLVQLGLLLANIRFSFPGFLTDTLLFQPELFASSRLNSMGDLLMITLFALVWGVLIYLHGKLEIVLPEPWKKSVAIVSILGGAFILAGSGQLIRTLVVDSNISFEIHRITTITGATVLGLLIVIMWLTLSILFIDRGITLFKGNSWLTVLYGAVAGLLFFLLIDLLTGLTGTWLTFLFFLLFLCSISFMRHHHPRLVPFSRYVLLILFISLFMTISFQENSIKNLAMKREVELVKLSSEHDAVAEMLFSEMSMAIRNDTIFARYIHPDFVDIDPVVNRLRRNYFSGYWTKYDIGVTVCRPDDRVYLEPPDDEWLHCYTFFEEMILQNGQEITGSDFYFLENLNGRISYLAAIPYYQDESEHRLFVELNSKIISEELGYPELLLDEQYESYTSSVFSFAKYNGGELFASEGEFPYRRSCSHYTQRENEFEAISMEGYEHSIYNLDETNTIIVGSPSITPIDKLIFFSYIFAFTFLLMGLLYFIVATSDRTSGFQWTFKNRIRYSLVSIMFLTFLLICSGTIYFIVKQYRVTHNDALRNIMRSVNIELMHKVEFEEDLANWSSDKYYNLDELLRKFSNVFNTDINLYNGEGILLATSRAEIFDRQFLSLRMNREIFESLSQGDASELIHNETIGNLSYVSVYVPLMNSDNQFLAYLNLPYFTRSGQLTRDVTNLVVAVINVYLILLLVILSLSVILADRITQPLRMIQNKIAGVSLSRRNERLEYERSDEIRGLVEEYNYMVQELEQSAGLLAQSERESAWREMAKQIAHEIKNPLTPMKLNIQHLQRTMDEGECDKKLADRIAGTLVEQIDSLSAIANEFSDFAKMPEAQSGRVNLVLKLQALLQLFENTEKAKIVLELDGAKEAWVDADKEQLLRVFINLVKNGMQSIPDRRDGLIKIRLRSDEKNFFRISFTDNGKGIPEEIRDKLFQPNFTTKSSGMGMGLAISKNIIRSFGGRIWYDTVLHQGTSFWVELPRSVEKTS